LINLLVYKTRPKSSEAAAVVVTILGMMLFFADQLEPGGLLGNVLAILSGLSFAGVFVCNRRADVDPQQATLLGFLINAAIALPFVPFQVDANPVAWGAVVFMGVVQVGLAYVLFTSGIKSTPALVACLITALEPVLNPVWVALVAKETPGPFAIAGGCVIVATVLVFNIWTAKQSDSDTNESGADA
jgi:drug/metabolite transporter (DMT)-like permease